MTQTPVRIGWNVATVAVVSIALTGCGGAVDSTGYEVILDQPEAAQSIPAEPADVTPTETANAESAAGSAEALATSDGTVEQPAEADLASSASEPGSPITEQVESVNAPLLAEATTAESAVDSASETANTADPASPNWHHP